MYLDKNKIKLHSNLILKSIAVYGFIAFLFSLFGFLHPQGEILWNPLDPAESRVDIYHISGHMLWGATAGVVSYSVIRLIIAGLFPFVMDFDHILQIFNLEMIGRMSHSIPFAIVTAIVMLLLFKKDYRLAAISIAAVLSHISFDLFLSESTNGTSFPLLAPFLVDKFEMVHELWLPFQIAAFGIVFVGFIINRKSLKKSKNI